MYNTDVADLLELCTVTDLPRSGLVTKYYANATRSSVHPGSDRGK